MMQISEFLDTLSDATPPAQLSGALESLWHDGRGDWKSAHQRVQNESDPEAAWVHAYLHRKEGDPANAGHWYRRAGREPSTGSHEAEWSAIAAALLAELTD